MSADQGIRPCAVCKQRGDLELETFGHVLCDSCHRKWLQDMPQAGGSLEDWRKKTSEWVAKQVAA